MALIVGTTGSEEINGSAGIDVLSGRAGLDILRGFASNDALSGGPDIDQLIGGAGNDLLFTEGGEFVEGGTGIDVAILTDSFEVEEVFSFTPEAVFGIEGIQDIPDANTTLTVAASLLNTVEGNAFQIAMGDGEDEVRVVNDLAADLEVTPAGQVVLGGKTIGLEGVDTLTILGTDGAVTNTFAAVDLAGVGVLGADAFTGPGSAAASAALLVENHPDAAVSEEADIGSVSGDLVTLLSSTSASPPPSDEEALQGLEDDVLQGLDEGEATGSGSSNNDLLF